MEERGGEVVVFRLGKMAHTCVDFLSSRSAFHPIYQILGVAMLKPEECTYPVYAYRLAQRGDINPTPRHIRLMHAKRASSPKHPRICGVVPWLTAAGGATMGLFAISY